MFLHIASLLKENVNDILVLRKQNNFLVLCYKITKNCVIYWVSITSIILRDLIEGAIFLWYVIHNLNTLLCSYRLPNQGIILSLPIDEELIVKVQSGYGASPISNTVILATLLTRKPIPRGFGSTLNRYIRNKHLLNEVEQRGWLALNFFH